jgi:hypothetical protein
VKPLHVQVAEALGWRMRGVSDSSDRGCGGTDFWVEPGHAIDGARSHCNVCDPENAPPRYDTDWSATGPIIEKYGIGLDKEPGEEPRFWWRARRDGLHVFGVGPIIAVCNLILALKAAGRL